MLVTFKLPFDAPASIFIYIYLQKPAQLSVTRCIIGNLVWLEIFTVKSLLFYVRGWTAVQHEEF